MEIKSNHQNFVHLVGLYTHPTPILFNVESVLRICQAKRRHIPVNVKCHCHLQNLNSHNRIGTQNIMVFGSYSYLLTQ